MTCSFSFKTLQTCLDGAEILGEGRSRKVVFPSEEGSSSSCSESIELVKLAILVYQRFLQTPFLDISGPIFDQATGQVILYGKKDLRLPSLHLDDLAVAVRSV